MSSTTWPGGREMSLSRLSGFGMTLVVLVCLYVALASSINLLPVFQGYNARRIVQVVVLLATGVGLIGSDSLRTRWLAMFRTLPCLVRIGLIVVMGLGIASAMQAAQPRYALLEVSQYVLLFCLMLVLAQAYHRNTLIGERVVIGTITVGVALYIIRFGVGYSAHLAGLVPLWPEAYVGFSHIRLFNQVQTWTLPLIVLPLFILRKRYAGFEPLLYGLAMTWWALLFASGGRGTTLACVAAIAVTGILFRKKAWRWLRAQVVAMFGGSVLYVLLFKVLAHTEVTLRTLANDSGRFELWESALALIQNNVWFGVGPMHYAQFPFVHAAHPHNALLQWGSEWGVPAAVMLVALFTWGAVAWLGQSFDQVQGKTPDACCIRVALTAALGAGAAHALLSGIVVMPVSQMLMVLLCGWALGMNVDPDYDRPIGALRRDSLLLRAATLGAVVVIALVSVQDTATLEQRHIDFKEKTESIKLKPRFWQQGYITY